ncbi:MAG TPA: hypothetical protein VNI20_09285 [Fimbriimonadaceae bacterium]|nr:hypothetical protein [Fimbriimonadaceae bacterium]
MSKRKKRDAKAGLCAAMCLAVLCTSCQYQRVAIQEEKPSPSRQPQIQNANPTLGPWAHDVVDTVQDVSDKINAGDYAGAGAIVDARLADTQKFGPAMYDFKAQLLALQGSKSQSLDLYMDLLGGAHGHWTPNSDDQDRIFDLAINLNRLNDADTIAANLLEDGCDSLNDSSLLNPPPAVADPNQRLAYAYLVRSMHEIVSQNYDNEINFCLSAKDLLPNDTIVLVATAHAYHDRSQPGDRDVARNLFLTAYENEAANPDVQAAIMDDVKTYGMVPFP